MPKPPEIPGIDSFKGEAYHTGRWPRKEPSFEGKRIGVIGTGGTGATLAGGVVVPITIATWAPGVWARMTNALVDIYNAAGTTLIADSIVVNAVNPDYAPLASPPAPNITLQTTAATTTGGTTTPAALATTRIVIKGWAQKSCLGLIAQLKNQGTQFGINAALYSVWKPKLVTVSSGTLTRLRIQAIGATAPIKTYALGYETAPTTGRLRLTSVQECGASRCLRAVPWSKCKDESVQTTEWPQRQLRGRPRRLERCGG